MSKKNYVAIGKILGREGNREVMIFALADYFQDDNPRFDKERFLDFVAAQKIVRG